MRGIIKKKSSSVKLIFILLFFCFISVVQAREVRNRMKGGITTVHIARINEKIDFVINGYTAVLKKIFGYDNFKKPLILKFSPKNIFIDAEAISKSAVTLKLVSDYQSFLSFELRRELLRYMILAKIGLLRNKKDLAKVPEWFLVGVEKYCNLYFQRFLNVKRESNYINELPFIDNLFHSNGKFSIEEICRYPVSPVYISLFKAYEETAFYLLRIISSTSRKLVESYLLKALKCPHDELGELTSSYLFEALKLRYKRQGKDFGAYSLADVDNLLQDEIKKTFFNCFNPYWPYQVMRKLDALCTITVVFSVENPVLEKVVELPDEKIRLEKLAYKLDKINNVDIVLNNLSADLKKLAFKSPAVYESAFNKMVTLIEELYDDRSIDPEIFEEEIKDCYLLFKYASYKADEIEDYMQYVENSYFPVWDLYPLEAFSPEFADSEEDIKIPAVERMLERAEQRYGQKKMYLK